MYQLKYPSHPGDVIRYEVLEENGLSVTDAAASLGVTTAALSVVVNCDSPLSQELATRIESVYGLPMETMLRIQAAHDLARSQPNREGNTDGDSV